VSAAESEFLARIWGPRGSIPAPAAGNAEFGSDTACVEVRCGQQVLIFDAGSGLAQLGMKLFAEGATELDLFFSHCHFDHIFGLPFLKPLYKDSVRARFYAGHFQDDMTCRQMVEQFMGPPYFPLTPKYFRAEIEFRDFRPPDVLTPGPGIMVSTFPLNHPNGAVGYRVDFAGRSICYVTDTEHLPGQLDGAILAGISGADILIYDCSYTDEEYSCCVGYGHSTWQEGVKLCEEAGVEQLVLFHHSPGRDDAELRRIEREAQARFKGAVAARTGLTLAP
jgi:phosphoribosyl 1,2-cyclic phosphodiesterase